MIPKITPPDADEALEGVDELPSAVPQEIDPTSPIRAIDTEAELEALCRQASEPPVKAAPFDQSFPAVAEAEAGMVEAASDDDELEALLKKGLAEMDTARRIKDKRRMVAVDTLTQAEREKLESAIHRWEVENEWLPLDIVMVVEHQECLACKATHESIYGIYEHQQSRKKDGGFRWLKYWPGVSNAALPKKVAVKFHEVTVCVTCAAKQGFVDITALNW